MYMVAQSVRTGIHVPAPVPPASHSRSKHMESKIREEVAEEMAQQLVEVRKRLKSQLWLRAPRKKKTPLLRLFA